MANLSEQTRSVGSEYASVGFLFRSNQSAQNGESDVFSNDLLGIISSGDIGNFFFGENSSSDNGDRFSLGLMSSSHFRV